MSHSRRPPRLGLLLGILCISGYCSLVYQVVWLRLLRLIFGASTASSAAVVAIFMGGLGLGGWILGKRVDRSENPLRFYAGLEAAIALCALVTPPLVGLVSWGYAALGGTPALGLVGGTVMRMLLATLVLGPATFFMGGTLPAAARVVEGARDRGRRGVGLLYGVNTLGAVTGALWTTFAAIEWLGLRKTLWLAVLLNLLIAVFARALSRSTEPTPTEATDAETEPVRPSSPGTTRVRGVWAVWIAAGLVGFAFFLMELVWYRMLSPILGGSSYTFGLILAVALAGIGLGGLAYGVGQRDRRPTFRTFAMTCALQALAVIVPLALGDRLAFLALELRDLGSAGFAGLVFGWVVVALIVVFPASFVAGYQFPVLIGLLGTGRRRVGREVGQAYAWNTGGAILGSLAGGFGLMPLLSAPGAWRLTAGLLALLAGAALLLHRRSGGSGEAGGGRLVPAVCAALALLLLLAPGPTAVWRHGGIGAGRMDGDFAGPNERIRTFETIRSQLVWEADGRESGVGLLSAMDYAFLVNGKSDGSARLDAPTMVMIGIVGALLHPEPRSSMVIGLGTGTTAGWLADVPTMERVDVAEIEPVIARVARMCGPVNRNVMDHPKVSLFFGDARELLMTTEERYDLIASEPSNPYRAGISSLFSHEFYEAVSERLTPDGLFLQWLQGYEIDASVVRTAYATLSSVFPHVETWRIHSSDLLLVAGTQPIRHDPERIRRRIEQEPYASALTQVWGVSGVEGLYSGYVGSPELSRRIAAQERGRINTDDHPVIEFGFARNQGRGGLFSVPDMVWTARRAGLGRPPELADALDWDRVQEMDEARQLLFETPVSLPPDLPVDAPTDALSPRQTRSLARLRYSEGRFSDVVALWSTLETPPRVRMDLLAVAHSLARQGRDETAAVLEPLARVQPTEARAVRGLWHAARGEDLQAARHLTEALHAYRTDPWPMTLLMSEALTYAETLVLRLAPSPDPEAQAAARRLQAQLDTSFAVGLQEPTRLHQRLELAVRVGAPEGCLEAAHAMEPHPPWREDVLRMRLECYRRHDDPLAETALDDLLEYRAGQPPLLMEPAARGSARQDGEPGTGPGGGRGDGR